MNHPKAVKASHSRTGSTLVASTRQGSASKANEQLTRKDDRSPNEDEGLLANTARAIGSMVGKFVAKTSGGISTTAKKARTKVTAGQGSTKKALRRSGRRSVARDSKGQSKESNDVGRSVDRGVKQNARIKVRAVNATRATHKGRRSQTQN